MKKIKLKLQSFNIDCEAVNFRQIQDFLDTFFLNHSGKPQWLNIKELKYMDEEEKNLLNLEELTEQIEHEIEDNPNVDMIEYRANSEKAEIIYNFAINVGKEEDKKTLKQIEIITDYSYKLINNIDRILDSLNYNIFIKKDAEEQKNIVEDIQNKINKEKVETINLYIKEIDNLNRCNYKNKTLQDIYNIYIKYITSCFNNVDNYIEEKLKNTKYYNNKHYKINNFLNRYKDLKDCIIYSAQSDYEYCLDKYNEDNNKVISFLDLSEKDFYKIKSFINNIK